MKNLYNYRAFFKRLGLLPPLLFLAAATTRAQTDTSKPAKPISLNAVIIEETPGKEDITSLPDKQETYLYAGKKTELIKLGNSNANIAENNPRQIFAKVPGVMVWEMDGTGNQVSISTRGVIAHRSWEVNARQNGNTINSDLYGYPEAHYNPPMEAVEKIEIVRGAGALQYGPQFGGMVNYVLKKPTGNNKIEFQTRESAGSYGLFSAFNAIGGKVKNFSYYTYYDFRRADGWRKNSNYKFNAWHVGLNYDFTKQISLSVELSHMDYVNHFAAGLTDSMFYLNPRQSNRARNYFNPTIYLPAVHLNIQATARTLVTISASAIFGQRNSVQIINLPAVNDSFNTALQSYNPRQVDRDYYHSYYTEARVLHSYKLLKNISHFAAGFRYGNTRTLRRQLGVGTTGSDFDLSVTAPYGTDLVLQSANYALFAENTFQFTKNFSVTPGIRFECLQTRMSGKVKNVDSTLLPFKAKRYFPLLGIGLQYKITNTINAYANYTQNYRPVAYSDIVPSTSFDRIDPHLKDANGSNTEAGIRGNWKEILLWDANFFLLQYNNRIGVLIQQDSSNTYFYKTNLGNMLNMGAEFFIELHPFHFSHGKLKEHDVYFYTSTAFNSAHYTKGTVKAAGQNKSIKGNRVENIPSWISRNGVGYRYKDFSAAFQFSYVSQCYADALNTVFDATGVNGIIPSYFLIDFNASYTFLKHFTVSFSASNIAGVNYFTRRASGYPGPGLLPSDGRSFLVSLGAKF